MFLPDRAHLVSCAGNDRGFEEKGTPSGMEGDPLAGGVVEIRLPPISDLRTRAPKLAQGS